MDKFRIRPFRIDDAVALPNIYRDAVEVLGARNYTPEQISVWSERAPDAAMYGTRASDGRCVWVAVDTERPDVVLAYADLEPDGHIDHLYCAPPAAGQGVGRRLLAAIEVQAREWRIETLYAEASETALPSFTRAGFHRGQRRDLIIDGVAIHNYAVQKRL